MMGGLTFMLISFLAAQQVAQAKDASRQNEVDAVTNLVLIPALGMINASWELVNRSGNVDLFWVTWADGSTNPPTCTVDEPTTNTEGCAIGFPLSPCTACTVTVQPWDTDNKPIGVPASAMNYTLPETIAPITPTCSPSGSTTDNLQFNVSWTSPGECVQFTVSWEGDVLWQDDKEPIRGTVTTREGSVAIDNPRPYTRYNVNVTWPSGSALCDGTTAQTAPSAPTLQSVVPASSRSLTASWSAPEQINGVLGAYTVTWAAAGWQKENTTVSTSLTIDGLDACVTYNVTVTASTGGGQTPSEAMDGTTGNEAPTAVTSLANTSSEARSVKLTWKRPDTACNVTDYYISYNGTAMWGTQDKHSGNKTSKDTSFVATGLVPYSSYKMCVLGRNSEGDGAEACLGAVETKEAAPSAPTSLSVVSASSRNLTASWSAPEQINGVLGDYTVTWAADGRQNESATADTSLTIDGLDACVTYSVTVTASTGAGEGEESPGEARTTDVEAPPVVTSLANTSSEARSITLTWTRPDTACNVTDYYISYDGAAMWGTLDEHNGSDTSEDTSFVATGLVPYSSYKMCVLGRNSEGDGVEDCLEAVETKEDAPGAPASVTTEPSNSSVTVSWVAPEALNGVLRNYLLSWADSNTTGEPLTLRPDTLTHEVEDLEPCHEYSFTVTGVTGGGPGENRTATGSPTTEVSAPTHVACSLSGSLVTVTWAAPVTECAIVSNTVSWKGDVLWSDAQDIGNDTAGATDSNFTLPHTLPYTRYTMTVAATVDGGVTGEEGICQNELVTPEKAPSPPQSLNYSEATVSSLTVTWEAPAELNGWLRNYRITWALGSDTVDNVTQNYTIGGLKEGTRYTISVTAVTINESEPATASFGTLPSASSSAGAIIGAVVGVLLVAALIAVAYMKRDWIRHNINTLKTAKNNKSPEGSHPGTIEDDYTAKLLREVQTQLQDVSANLEERFLELKDQSFVGESTAAMQDVNRAKNRYINILPFDNFRVKLKRRGDSDYINASYVTSTQPYHIDFIACQGPKDNTVADFWHMIWELDASIIVMLANCVEGGKPKCYQYWPLKGSLSFPPFTITCEGQEDSSSSSTIRTLRITKERTHRVITQCHYSNWPDFGVPHSEDELLGLVKDVRGRVDKAKVVVHCSAGVGRTGTFIGLWNLAVAAEKKDPGIDVKKTILEMRKHRPELVQSKDQYAYLIRCFSTFLEDPHKWRPETQDKENSSPKPERHYENVTRSPYENQEYLGIEMSASAGVGEPPQPSTREAQHQPQRPARRPLSSNHDYQNESSREAKHQPQRPARRPLSSNHDYQNESFVSDEVRRSSASTAQPRQSSGNVDWVNAPTPPPPQNDLSREYSRPSQPFLQQLNSSLQHHNPQDQPPRSNTRPPLPKRPVQ